MMLEVSSDAGLLLVKEFVSKLGIDKLLAAHEKIRDKTVFKIKGYDRKCIVGRMDFVESLLRRRARGIQIEKIRVDCDI